jgi:LAS superfamily LD-carboxypeptidase LdcB
VTTRTRARAGTRPRGETRTGTAVPRARPAFDALELTGRARTHVVEIDEPRCTLHRSVVQPFLRMRAAAAKVGIDLAPASSFRDFERQVGIWNAKWNGNRPLLDRDGRLLDPAALAPSKRVDAILAWSAAPGMSRHHWGTDVDVYDRAAVPADYRVQLVPAEYAPGGPFARLAEWLDGNMQRWGFYRPYATYRGGVQPEPWHLSHAPVAREAMRRIRATTLARAIASGDVAGGEALLKKLPTVYARYVRAVDPPPRARAGRSPPDRRG